MAATVGLDQSRVIDAAVELLRENGRLDGLSLRDVAVRLNIRVQSLYAHVAGVTGLRHELALRGLDDLARRLMLAAVGKAGTDAVDAIVRAYLKFAADEPGLYEASLQPPGNSAQLRAAMDAVMQPLNLVFASYGLTEVAAAHWYRMVFASVHGFAVLRRDGLLTLPGDVDETLTHYVRALVDQLEREGATRAGRRSRRSASPG